MTADNFYRNVMISAGGHMVVAMLILFRAAMMPTETIVIRNAIRVDVVGLPEKMQEPAETATPSKPAPAPVAAPEPAAKTLPKKSEPLPSLKVKPRESAKKKEPDHKAQADAFRKLQQESAFSKMSEKSAKNSKAKATRFAGNQISHGSATDGLDQTKADEYFNVVNDTVHAHWVLPQWLAESDLKAQVRVLIDERGYVIKKIWIKRSGNEVFDAKVDESIDASSPLPAPPAGLRGGLASAGIGLNFP